MEVRSLFFSCYGPTDGPTDGRTDLRTDKPAYRVACSRLKRGEKITVTKMFIWLTVNEGGNECGTGPRTPTEPRTPPKAKPA